MTLCQSPAATKSSSPWVPFHCGLLASLLELWIVCRYSSPWQLTFACPFSPRKAGRTGSRLEIGELNPKADQEITPTFLSGEHFTLDGNPAQNLSGCVCVGMGEGASQ